MEVIYVLEYSSWKTKANNLYDDTNNELLPLSERKILKSK